MKNGNMVAVPKWILAMLVMSWFIIAGGLIFLDFDLQNQADVNGRLIKEGILCLYHQEENPPIEECRTFLQTVEDDNGN